MSTSEFRLNPLGKLLAGIVIAAIFVVPIVLFLLPKSDTPAHDPGASNAIAVTDDNLKELPPLPITDQEFTQIADLARKTTDVLANPNLSGAEMNAQVQPWSTQALVVNPGAASATTAVVPTVSVRQFTYLSRDTVGVDAVALSNGRETTYSYTMVKDGSSWLVDDATSDDCVTDVCPLDPTTVVVEPPHYDE